MSTRKVLAELLGTFLFLTIGYLSVAALGITDPATPVLLVVPFAFGFGLLAAIFAFGHISGGHFNPAVTVAALIDGRTTPVDAVGYIVAQVIGALAAAGVVLVAVSQDAVAAGITAPGSGITDVGVLAIETVLTAGFVVLILSSTRHAAGLAPLAIPLTLVALHFGAATLTGASFNPARSIGSAVVGGDLSVLWLYLVAPVIGAIVGAIVFKFAADREQDAETEVTATA